jgi:MEMO1 family protein
MLAVTQPHGAVRPPSAAGLYYPREEEGLRSALKALLGTRDPPSGRLPKALVVPHAGYAYSGAVAATAFRTLSSARAADLRHVVLLGPSHRVKVHGLALPSCDFLSTPLGDVPVNAAGRQRLRQLGLAGVADAPHAHEHSLEVQVPFLQTLLGEFDLLPVAVGFAPPEQVGRALEAVWGGAETLIVVSSDLSHHHTHIQAQALDEKTARRLIERRSDLSEAQACGADSLNGLMEVARKRGLGVELLDRRTSGDTAGDNQRVVGYGSFALYEPG